MSDGLKNVCRTTALPGASRNRVLRMASTTMVDVVDSASRPRGLLSSRERPPVSYGLGLNGRDDGVDLQVLVLQLLERAVRGQRRQRLVHAGHQRVTLGEQQPVVLAGGREL